MYIYIDVTSEHDVEYSFPVEIPDDITGDELDAFIEDKTAELEAMVEGWYH